MAKKIKATKLYVAIATSFFLVGCSTTQPVAIEINEAKAVIIAAGQSASANRVIALANGSAEIIAALGLKANLIGRDIASSEEELKDIPIVTSGHQVVAENILKLNPDLVLIDDATGPLSAIQTLRASGIRIIKVRQAWTLSDINLKIADIASAIGANSAGDQLSKEINSALTDLKQEDRKVRIGS